MSKSLVVNLRNLISISLFFFLPRVAPAVEPFPCDQGFGALGRGTPGGETYFSTDPATLLGRSLSASESEALSTFGRKVNQEYTPQDHFAESKALKKAGFTPEEIEKLRRARVLRLDSMMFATDEPAEIAVQKSPLEELSGDVIQTLKKEPERRMTYIRDTAGEFHVVPELELERLDGKLLVVDAGERKILAMEAGTFRYDSMRKTPEFSPHYRLDPDQPENEQALEKLRRKRGFEGIVAPKETASSGTLTLDCMDLMSKQARGKGFVISKISGSAALTALGLALTEPYAHRLDSEAGRAVVMADFVGSILASGIHGVVGKKIATSGVSDGKAVAMRLGTSYGIIAIQNPIYQKVMEDAGNVNKEESEKKAKAISTYDASYATVRAYISQKIDRTFLEQLPTRFYEGCRKNPRLTKLVLTPGMVRFYESAAFAFIYYGGRATFVGQ